MGSFLDGTLFVIDAAKGRRRLSRMGRELLGRSGANTLGAVLNRVPAVARFGYGGYYGRTEETPAATVDLVAERRGASIDPDSTLASVQVPRAARAKTSANRSRSTPRS
jgi:hypothetical protein